jgi:hypothetical protein
LERITRASLFGDWVTDDAISHLEALTHLRSLTISGKRLTDVGLAKLQQLPRLTELALFGDSPFSEAEFARLAEIRGLRHLSVWGGATPEGISQLRGLSKLHWLGLFQIGDNKPLERLADLPELQRLTLDVRFKGALQLKGLAKLRELTVHGPAFNGGWAAPSVTLTQTLRLSSLPALEMLEVSGFDEFRLENAQVVRDLSLDNVVMDRTAIREIQDCAQLESITLRSVFWTADAPIELNSLDKLSRIETEKTEFAAIKLRNLPSLQSLKITENNKLVAIDLQGVPKLEELEIGLCPGLPGIDLRGASNLKTLAIENIPRQFVTPCPYLFPARPRRIRIIGLAQLGSLESLNLGGILVDHSTVSDIVGLTRLRTLRLPGTWLTDSEALRLALLVNLDTLELAGTEITDKALSLVQNLPVLKTVWLNGTLASHAGIKALSERFPNLEIRYDWEHMDAMLLAKQAERTRRGLHSVIDVGPTRWSCYLGDQDLHQLNGLDGLGWLNLNGSHVTDAGLASLTGLGQLQSLDLTGTHVSDAGLAALAKFRALRALNLSDTMIRGDGLRNLQSLEHLQILDLSDTDVTDETLAQLRYVPHVQRLSLAATQITDAGLSQLQQLPELRVLNLDSTAVSAAGLAQLHGLIHLEAIGLGDGPAPDPALANLEQFPQLRLVKLGGGAAIVDQGLEPLTRLKQLQELDLQQHRLTLDELRRLAAMKSLRELWLNDPDLGQEQLAVWRQFTSLEKLHISGLADDTLSLLRAALSKVYIGYEAECIVPVFEPRKFDEPAQDFDDPNPNGDPPAGVAPSSDGYPVVGAIISPDQREIPVFNG